MYQKKLTIFDFHKLNYFVWHPLDIKLYHLIIFPKDFSFPKLSGVKCINIIGGHAWQHFFMTCSKLEAMAIYLVKQDCGNDILASVYIYNIKDVKSRKMYQS